MMTDKKREILKSALTVEYIMEDEDCWGMQALRDAFPDGVPLQEALGFVKEAHKGKPFHEISALTVLAMVPEPGIKSELLAKLESLKGQEPQTDENYRYRFYLMQALRFIGVPEGTVEFEELKSIMKTYPQNKSPVPVDWFSEFEEKYAQWKKDLEEGKRWEIPE